MTLVFLWGGPAVGKLTVARRVAETMGFRLFHNHLVVDTALSLYDFGSPGFVALRATLWEACFRQMAKDPSLSGVVFTFNPESSVSQDWLDAQFAAFAEAGVDVFVAKLVCDESTVEARLAASSRSGTGKLRDVELYRELREQGVFDSPIVPGPVAAFDTTSEGPEEVAAQICAALVQRT
jgi:predicted kinase